MVRNSSTRSVDASHAQRYLQSGRTFLAAAVALDTIAGEDESYGNAIALLAVHAAISHADAIAIGHAGKKSTSGDHRDAARLLRAVLGNRFPDRIEKELLVVLAAKDAVAYQGRYYPLNDAQLLLAKTTAFVEWAEQKYQER